MWIRYLGAMLVLPACALFALAADPPNNREPQNALRIHGRGLPENVSVAKDKDLDALVLECLALDKQVGDTIDQLKARLESKTLEKADPKLVASTWVRIEQLKRSSVRLRQLGEPAGVDFDFRQAQHVGRMSSLVETFRTYKSISEQAKRNYPQFKSEGQKLQGVLKEVGTLLAAKKISEAEQRFYDAWDRILLFAVFYKEKDYFDVMKPFTDMKVQVETAADTYWRDLAASALADARDKERPDYEPTLKAVAAAATQLQKAAQAKVGDTELTGPLAVRHFGGKWKELHLAAYRSRACEWARSSVARRSDQTRLARITDDDAKFTLDLLRGLSGLIAADAQRATEAEAPALYHQYLAELAALGVLQTDSRFQEQMNAGLEPLRNKSPTLAAEAAAYENATGELLWWRRQSAKAVYATLQKNFPPAANRLAPAVTTKGTFDRGLLTSVSQNTGVAESELRCPCAEVILHAWPLIQDQRSNLTDISPVGSRASSHYAGRLFGIPNAAPFPAERIAALKADLLVTDTAAPLTLDAATALYAMENGYYRAVGGEVSSLYLESLIVTFATLTPRHWAMTMLDPLPAEKVGNDVLPQMVLRCDLKPTWVYHDCFLSDVPPSGK